jgi:hypothetical protein
MIIISNYFIYIYLYKNRMKSKVDPVLRNVTLQLQVNS